MNALRRYAAPVWHSIEAMLPEYFRIWLRINVISELFGPNADVWKGPIFVHVPKAAGHSISKSGAYTVEGHKTLRYYEHWCPANMQLPFTFAIVRDPIDRARSAFYYLLNGGGNELDRRWSQTALRGCTDFEDFVLRRLRSKNILKWMHFKPQVEFLVNSKGEIGVDKIIYFENLSKEWPDFAAQHGLRVELLRENVTKKKADSFHLSEEAISVIKDAYSDDYSRLFNMQPKLD